MFEMDKTGIFQWPSDITNPVHHITEMLNITANVAPAAEQSVIISNLSATVKSQQDLIVRIQDQLSFRANSEPNTRRTDIRKKILVSVAVSRLSITGSAVGQSPLM